MGLTTLSMLWWMVLTIGRRQANAWRGHSTAFLGSSLPRTRRLAWLGLAMLFVQLALGGWTSSHYAATACPDFPTCQGHWWPPLRGEVGIHFAHRLGAIGTLGLLGWLTWQARAAGIGPRAAAAALGLRVLISISMVLRGFPLWLVTAHNAAPCCCARPGADDRPAACYFWRTARCRREGRACRAQGPSRYSRSSTGGGGADRATGRSGLVVVARASALDALVFGNLGIALAAGSAAAINHRSLPHRCSHVARGPGRPGPPPAGRPFAESWPAASMLICC
jgi:hypothetical protein